MEDSPLVWSGRLLAISHDLTGSSNEHFPSSAPVSLWTALNWDAPLAVSVCCTSSLTFSQSIWVRGFSTGLGATFTLRDRHCTERDRENSKFSKTTTRDWGRQLKTYLCWTVSVGGFRINFCTLFDCWPVFFCPPFPLAADHNAAESPRRRGDVTRRWVFIPVSKFCWTRNRCGCDFFCDKSWGFLPGSEVSLIAQRSEVCTHCHDRGQTNTPSSHTQWLE